MAKAKATHSGECQKCGASQKLPSSVLAKHGYNVTWGFFNGVCGGSGHDPFEVSCDLIKDYIEQAKTSLAVVTAEIETLLKPATEPKGWYHEWQKAEQRRFGSGKYVWRQVILRAETVTRDDNFSYVKFFYTDCEGKEVPFTSLPYELKTAEEAATYLNQGYIKVQLIPLHKQIASYIKWQEHRVATWKPGVLEAICPK